MDGNELEDQTDISFLQVMGEEQQLFPVGTLVQNSITPISVFISIVNGCYEEMDGDGDMEVLLGYIFDEVDDDDDGFEVVISLN